MADEEDNQIEDLFGSDDDDDDDFGKGRLRSNKSADDEPGPPPEEDLEDDLGDVVTKGTQGTGAYGGGSDYEDQGDQRSRRRLPAGGRRPLARTGAPIDYAAPLLSVPPPDGETHLLREGLIGIEPTPFDPATFAGEEEIIIDEKGLMKVKPADRTKIRWRYARQKGPDGSEQLVPESNARFVRWSDGSLQLMLGDEVFDVVTADISAQRAYMVAYSGVVQGQAALTSKMGFRLATLNSKLYARMREEVDKRTVKVKRVQQHVEALDPAKEKERRAKEAEELLRNRAQLEARQQRTMARYPGGGGGRSRGRPELNTRFLEEEDGIEVGGDEGFIDDAEEEPGYRRRRLNDDEEEEAARRLQSAKRAPPAAAAGGKRRRMQEESEAEEDDEEEEEEYVDSEGDSEEEEGGDEEGGDDDEEEDEPAGRAKTPPKQLRAVPPLRGKVIPHMRPPERPAAPAAKVRRGVVLSDDEED